MEQRKLKSLLQPSAYPEPTTSVNFIQTHVSYLFLTDRFVYKIKKPVDLGFLDFTSLERRRFYCEEEVRLNRRLCPDMYLGVVEVRTNDESATFTGEGAIIDYAVKMVRLPQERMLDRLLEQDHVTPTDITRIARTIADFHLSAERNSDIDSFGSTDIIRQNWSENFRQLERYAGITIGPADLSLLQEWVDGFITANERIFKERIDQGHIRDCDGDMHMQNICLTDRVWIFDCIEFNNRFRYSDTAADIAFLLMDFDLEGFPAFSDIFLQDYIASTGDTGVRQVLDFYKTYRAMVRGKVESFRLENPEITAAERTATIQRAQRYFRLARGYVIRRKLPLTLFITCGTMGSGKSTVSSALAHELGLEKLSSDIIRKKLVNMPPHEHTFTSYGTGIYDEATTRETYGRLLSGADSALAEGRCVIIDASFGKAGERDSFRSLAAERGAVFHILITQAPEDVVHNRLALRSTLPREASDGRCELLPAHKGDFEPVSADEQQQIYLDTSRPLHDTIEVILKHLGLV